MKIVKSESDLNSFMKGKRVKTTSFYHRGEQVYAVSLDDVFFPEANRPEPREDGLYIRDASGADHKLSYDPLRAEKYEYQRLKERLLPVKVEPHIEVIDSLEPETALAGLLKLIDVVEEFPEKFFVVAGGNNGDDIRKARVSLAKIWPENLLINAEWMPESAADGHVADLLNRVYGMDTYAYLPDLELESGSTRTTAIFTALFAVLRHYSFPQAPYKKLDFERIKDTIVNIFCKEVYYRVQGLLGLDHGIESARLLNWPAVEAYFRLLHGYEQA